MFLKNHLEIFEKGLTFRNLINIFAITSPNLSDAGVTKETSSNAMKQKKYTSCRSKCSGKSRIKYGGRVEKQTPYFFRAITSSFL